MSVDVICGADGDLRSSAIAVRDLQPWFPSIDPARINAAVVLEEGRGAAALGIERFDSQLFGRRIGRLLALRAERPADYRELLAGVTRVAHELGYAQVLRRIAATELAEIWALEAAGFELMDIGVTFARALDGVLPVPAPDGDLEVRTSTDDDLARIVPAMVDQPWGSRYEADPSYDAAQVRELRSAWLWNSHRGRAQRFIVGVLDGQPAGYVTCLVDEPAARGEIELVGTLPRWRGRRVAPRLLDHAMAWFSERVGLVTVRTQATNITAANLYERSGFRLHESDLTFRLTIQEQAR